MANQHENASGAHSSNAEGIDISPKSFGIATILAMIFGVVGVHHFYLGNWMHGLFDFALFLGGLICIAAADHPGLLALGVFLLLADAGHTLYVTYRLFVGKCRDGEGRLVAYPGQLRG